jgi:hypothetical protein
MLYLPLSLLLLDAAPDIPQVKPVKDPTAPQAFAYYGEAIQMPLTEVANNPELHGKENVRTTGELRSLGFRLPYNLLTDSGARVLLIQALNPHDADEFIGRRVEITGIVRLLPEHQSTVRCNGETVPESKCEDPQLPALPDARQDWPRASITVLTMSDAPVTAAKEAMPEGVRLLEIITNPGPYAVKPITVIGMVGGRNLFGDLPKGSERTPGDWVLKQGRDAVWVTGKPPQGKGWKLDPGYRGDTTKWLQVTGRVEAANGVTYLRATNVALTSGPKPADDER